MSETEGSLLGHVEDGTDSALQALFFVVIALFLGMHTFITAHLFSRMAREVATNLTLSICRHFHQASFGLDQDSLHSAAACKLPDSDTSLSLQSFFAASHQHALNS